MGLDDYHYSLGLYRGNAVIWVDFAYHNKLKDELKKRFPSAKWSQAKQSWYLPDLPSIRTALGLKQKPPAHDFLSKMNSENQEAFQAYRNQLILKGYSPNTLKVYLSEFAHLLILLKHHKVSELTPDKLKGYLLYCATKLKMKERKINGKINAIKFYFESVLHKPKMFIDIPRPKKASRLPKMLSKAEVNKVLNALTNKKHLLILKLCYGLGLRLNEICNLKLSDINSDGKQIRIEASQGKKDRYVALPATILHEVKAYYKLYQPKYWLFEGRNGGQYSKNSIQNVFKKAMLKAGIKKNIGIHGLKHRYATQLLESGADIRFFQSPLEHPPMETSQLYTDLGRKPRLVSVVH